MQHKYAQYTRRQNVLPRSHMSSMQKFYFGSGFVINTLRSFQQVENKKLFVGYYINFIGDWGKICIQLYPNVAPADDFV